MDNKNRFIVFSLTVAVIAFLGGFSLSVLQASHIRQARFSVDILGKILNEYHRIHHAYPAKLEDIPKFYAVSAKDRFYLDSKIVAQKKWGGYSYALSNFDADRFVLTATPLLFWPPQKEFGITEQGVLRVNHENIGKVKSYDDVSQWKVIPHMDQKLSQ